MSAETNRKLLEQYIASQHEDLSMMAADVVFTNMSTGDDVVGRDALREMLHYVYHVAFDAHSEPRAIIADDSHGVLEGTIVGRHIGEFAGVAATGKDVRIPLCVVYDFRNDKIVSARIYVEVPAFLAQVGATPASNASTENLATA
jgi:steroid delta-isomerase-like uncharacterized protein